MRVMLAEFSEQIAALSTCLCLPTALWPQLLPVTLQFWILRGAAERPSSTQAQGLSSVKELTSTFFRRYWLILYGSPEDVREILVSVDDLNLANVGIARYSPDTQDNLSLLKAPKG